MSWWPPLAMFTCLAVHFSASSYLGGWGVLFTTNTTTSLDMQDVSLPPPAVWMCNWAWCIPFQHQQYGHSE